MWKWLGAATAATDKEPEKEGSSAPTSRVLNTGSLNASQSNSAASFKHADSDKSPVVQVTDRICAFVFGTLSRQKVSGVLRLNNVAMHMTLQVLAVYLLVYSAHTHSFLES